MKKITVVGNLASGKTTLANQLSARLQIPVTHVDAIQFNQKLQIEDLNQTRLQLQEVEKRSTWIIDGHGPLDMFENRFALADQIIFIDRPIWANYVMLSWRLLKSLFFPRKEFSGKQSEWRWTHIKKMYRTIGAVHKKMRPELIRMLNRTEFKSKVLVIKSLEYFTIKP